MLAAQLLHFRHAGTPTGKKIQSLICLQLFDISAIVFSDCISEMQQKHHLAGSSRQLVLIKALFYNSCTMSWQQLHFLIQHFYNIEHCFDKIQPSHWYDFIKFWCCKSVVILVSIHHILMILQEL